MGTTEQLLRASAHGARNHVATLRSAAQLVDDPEVRAALTEATSALQLLLERSVASARIAGGAAEESAPIELEQLIALAVRRARREGAPAAWFDGDAGGVSVSVPGRLAERLLADLVHLDPGCAPSIEVRESVVVLGAATAPDAARPELDAYLHELAAACGGEASIEPGSVRICLSTR